jgi:hypothetical protein
MEKLNLYVLLLITLVLKISCNLEEIPEFKIDADEKDKVLSCLQIISKRIQLDGKTIDDITNGFGPEKERGMSKITGDMMSLCYNKITDDVVKTIFNNLTYTEFDWSDDYDKYAKLDYSKYRSANDLELTPEQQIIFYKVEKAKEEYIRLSRERQEAAAKSFPPIFGIDISQIAAEFKIVYMIAVFTLFAIGILYALKKLRKEPKKKSKKRN